MYRVALASLVAFLTFGTPFQETKKSLPDPRNTEEQIVGVERLVGMLEDAIKKQNADNDRQAESNAALMAMIQNHVEAFEGATGSIESLNKRVEGIALVATSAASDEDALEERVALLEKTVADLSSQLEAYKQEKATAAPSAPQTAAPAVAVGGGGSTGNYASKAAVGGGSTGNYPAKTAVGGGSTGGYASKAVGGGSTGNYPAASAAVGGGSTGNYPAASAVVGGGSTGGYPAASTSYQVVEDGGQYYTDAYGNLVPATGYTSGNAVFCVDAYGNQVPCNDTASAGKSYTTGGPLRDWLAKRRNR